MPMTVQRRRRHDRSFAFYPSAAVVGKAQRLRPNIRSRSPRSASSSCKSAHQWISLTNAQFESALQKARKQPGAAHVEILLGSKMVTPPPPEVTSLDASVLGVADLYLLLAAVRAVGLSPN